MLGLLLTLVLLAIVSIATARICVSKHWPLWLGLSLGIVGCFFGMTFGRMAANNLAWSRASFAIMYLLLPVAGSSIPLWVASLLPLPPRTRSEHFCDRCGSPTKASTPVCEKCVD